MKTVPGSDGVLTEMQFAAGECGLEELTRLAYKYGVQPWLLPGETE